MKVGFITLGFIALGLVAFLYGVFTYERPSIVIDTTPQPQATTTPARIHNFNENGYVVFRPTGSFLIYEKPGQPALQTKLDYDEKSICEKNGREIYCILLSATLDSFAEEKQVHVTGYEKNSVTIIDRLTVGDK